MAFAASSDLLTMRISNRVVLLLVGGFFVVALAAGLPLETIGMHLAAAGLVLAGAAILYWLFWRGAAKDRLLCVALGLIMAGTIGNCYDRIVGGQVRDFIYFELINWPIFNLADSMLVCGAGVLMLQAVFADSKNFPVYY